MTAFLTQCFEVIPLFGSFILADSGTICLNIYVLYLYSGMKSGKGA